MGASPELESILLLASPDMLLSSISLPAEMLHAADNKRRREHRLKQRLKTVVVAESEQSLELSSGLKLGVDCTFEVAAAKLNQHCLVIVPTFWRNPIRTLSGNGNAIGFLQQAEAKGAAICCVSTGSFLLAEAGLLNRQAATTHWFYMDQFAARYPEVRVQRGHLITQAGRLYCAGSINALADLVIRLIETQFGPSCARHVAMQFSPEIRGRFSDSVYVEGEDGRHHDELIADVQFDIRTHLNEPIPIHFLAKRYEISVRTLSRRFKTVTGMSPKAYQQACRLEEACELLRRSNLGIADIAESLGFQDSSHFGRQFKQRFQTSPSSYKRAVRAKLFTA